MTHPSYYRTRTNSAGKSPFEDEREEECQDWEDSDSAHDEEFDINYDTEEE